MKCARAEPRGGALRCVMDASSKYSLHTGDRLTSSMNPIGRPRLAGGGINTEHRAHGCLDLASPTGVKFLAAFTAARLQTHLASRQEERVVVYIPLAYPENHQSSHGSCSSCERFAEALKSAILLSLQHEFYSAMKLVRIQKDIAVTPLPSWCKLYLNLISLLMWQAR